MPALEIKSNQKMVIKHCIAESSYLLGEQSDIPTTYAFDVSNEDFEMLEFVHSNGIESYIEKNQRPFKKRVDCVSCV